MKKLFTLVLAAKLFGAGATVHDPVFMAQYLTEMTKLLNNASAQVKSLGGIATTVNETKTNIYNTAVTLENAMWNFTRAAQNFTETAQPKNIYKSIQKLSSTDPADFTTYNGNKGVFYDDIQGYINAGDEISDERMRSHKEAINKLRRIANALRQTSYKDFKDALDIKERVEYLDRLDEKFSNEQLVKIKEVVASYYFADNNKSVIDQKLDRLKRLSSEMANNKLGMVQMQQLTNMYLSEMLKELMLIRKDMSNLVYASAIYYSKGITHKDRIRFSKLQREMADTTSAQAGETSAKVNMQQLKMKSFCQKIKCSEGYKID